FSAGQYKETLAMLDEAADALGPVKDRSGAAAGRLFSDALLFAQRTGRDNNEIIAAMAPDLFDRAAANATTLQQQVLYRTERARYHTGQTNKTNSREAAIPAVDLYQEILLDPAMRSVMINGTDNSSQPAGILATDAISDLIKRRSSAVYE